MGAFRERHPTLDGMGHADRPWLYNAFGLDSQPGRLCLSSGWSRHANTNANRESFGYGNTDCISHCDGNFYTNTETHTHAKESADAETASNTCSPAIARN